MSQKQYIFTYGSLILEKSPIRLIPIESAFITGYRIRLGIGSAHTFIITYKTGNAGDIVSGYLAEVDNDLLLKLDKYEGAKYKREKIQVFKRNNTAVDAFIYVDKN